MFSVTLPDGLGTEDRTISFIELSQAGLNDTGTLAFTLSFTDDTQGIFTATTRSAAEPEPDSLGLLGLLGLVSLAMMMRRRK